MPQFERGVVDTDHPSIVNGIRNMVAQGYSKETICRIIGAPPEVVESHQRLMQRGQVATPAPVKHRSKRTDSEQREMLERMAQMRAKRKAKIASVAEALKTEV